jgi:cell division protein ZapA (FtsZ GTPase activity inhibitor)
MNNTDKSALNLVVLGQSITVTCPTQEIESLTKSATYLENKLFELRRVYPALHMDKLIAMVALQLTHESLRLKREDETLNTFLTDFIEELDHNIATAAELNLLSSRHLENA